VHASLASLGTAAPIGAMGASCVAALQAAARQVCGLAMRLVDEGGRSGAHGNNTFAQRNGGPMGNGITEISSACEGLVAGTASSVVSVRSHRLFASGFVWRKGLIITAEEGVAEEGEIGVVLPGGGSAAAHVAGRDPATAIALLRCEGLELPAVTLAATIPPVGALTVVVGAEEGSPRAALGMVGVSRGPWQSLRGGAIEARIELDARLRPSAQGGLAVSAAGQPFGMVVRGPRRRALVIPSATIVRIAAKLEASGRIPRGYLGLALQPVTVEGGGTGVMVMSVDPKGPGAAADIHQGDVLVGWDGRPIGRLQTLLRALGSDSVGRSLALELRRGGQTVRATLQIAERPAA
jgi:S1-C subfamily serine protease